VEKENEDGQGKKGDGASRNEHISGVWVGPSLMNGCKRPGEGGLSFRKRFKLIKKKGKRKKKSGGKRDLLQQMCAS